MTSPLPETQAKPPLFTHNYVLAVLVNGLLFFGFQLYPSALPPYLQSLGADEFLMGLLTALSTLPAIISRPVAGLLLDRYGRFPVLLCGLGSMTLIAVIMDFFPTLILILVLRTLNGLAWGLAGTGTATTAADFIPRSRMGEGMGYFSLSCSLAMAVAPALALSISPEWMFHLGGVFLAASLALAFCIHYRKLPDPGKNRGTLLEKRSLRPAAIVMCTNASYGAVVTFLAPFALSEGIAHVGLFFTVFAVALMVSRPYVGRLVDRIGCKAALLPGILALALSLLILSYVHNLFTLLISGFLYGLAHGTVMSASQTLAILRAPKERLGAANATYSTCFDLGLGLGALCFGALASTVSYSMMFLICALSQILPLLVLKGDHESDRAQDL